VPNALLFLFPAGEAPNWVGLNMSSKRGRSNRSRAKVRPEAPPVVHPGLPGGLFKPLTEHNLKSIHDAALTLLSEVGLGNPIEILKQKAEAKGCRLNDQNRLCFPKALVEDIIAATPREIVLHGRNARHDVEYRGSRVHFGSSGEAIRILDSDTGKYRPSTLLDIYDCGRLVDSLEHVHDYSRWVIATDIQDTRHADINSAYACFAATEKPIALSFEDASNVDPILHMACLLAGGEQAFRERPFCNGGGCCVVSPLAYGEENSKACIESTKFNSPVWIVVAPQAGATAPAALAGTLVQAIAEALAGILLVQLVVPDHPVILGPWPFVSDLRTGSFSGGGGEEGILNAAAAQFANYYDLPCSVSAGMTDSKLPDNQAGYEKGVNITLAAMAGANSIGEAAGMMGSLMGCSFESLVIDNDMIGCIQRALKGIEVNEETLSIDVIREVVIDGPGHFLSHKQTLDRMESEYLYPEIADRSSLQDWELQGRLDIYTRAKIQVQKILSSHYPTYIEKSIDSKIRENFPILLNQEDMRPESRRWTLRE